jgi:PKD repeat protein
MRRIAALALVCGLVLAIPTAASAGGISVEGPFRAAPHRAASHGIPPFRPADPAAYARGRQQAAAGALFSGSPMAPSPAAPGRHAAVLPGSSQPLNQPGLAADSGANSGTPPDPTGAVGPNNYVEFVNSTIRVYKKDDLTASGILSTAAADTFVGHTGDNVFDIQVQYDPQADRWFYLTDDCAATPGDCSVNNFLAFGFSKTNDPSDLVNGWCRYRVASSTNSPSATSTDFFDDYPKLGHDDNHLIFGTNVFNTASFVSARIWTVDKSALVPGAGNTCPSLPAGSTHFFSGTAASPTKDSTNLATVPLKDSANQEIATPIPADTMDASTAGYVVAAEDAPSTKLMAWHVGGTGSTPTLTADGNITVTSYSQPATVPQPGSTDELDSSDTRLTQAVALTDPDAGAEAVWTQHTVNGSGGRSVVRWYELIPSTKTKRQEGTISNASSFVFNGAIAPTLQGNEAVIEYNVGGSSQQVQIRASSRTHNMALGAMGGEVTLVTSTDIDQDFSCPSVDPTQPSCRWGDYAGASTDPSSQHTVWGTNQYNVPPDVAGSGDAQWATQNFALTANASPTAAFDFSPKPAYTSKPVSFDASGSTDPDGGGITSYQWDYGDGSTGTGVTPTHVYATAGNFQVTLTVTNAAGSSGSVTQSVAVVSPAPTASFTVSPAAASTGQAVTFDGSASHDAEPGSGIAKYAWDFDGNGTTDQTTTTPTVTHAYAGPGTFPARLVVTDSDDGISSGAATQTVTVTGPPTPGASSNPPPSGGSGSGTPPSTPSGSGSAFKLVLSAPKSIRSSALLKKGLVASSRCSARCKFTVTLSLPAKLAKLLRTKAKIAALTATAPGGSKKTLRIRLTRKAKKALRSAALARLLKTHRYRLVLKVVAVTADGHRASSTKSVTLKR